MLQSSYRKSSVKKLLRSILKGATGIDILRAEPNYLNFDVVHHPLSTMKPSWKRFPSVLTFLDMQQEFYPQFFTSVELETRRATSRASASAATRIIAISEHAKKCLEERYEIEADKIDVIYPGYGEEYRVIDDWERVNAIRRKYGLEKPFLYYPAATWPHKNHRLLLFALKLLKERYGFDGELVLTGVAMNTFDTLMSEAVRLGLDGMVRVLGYLPYEELPCLYTLAKLMVFPSLFEGFGIPVVEAMACGCPVACSNATSLPEVIGGAGIMFDPSSQEDMAEKIWQAWIDDGKLELLRQAGLKRVAMFTWKDAARETLDVYKRAAELN
jgi:glycosyltransferase involved in cell wall biosynthesis